MNRWRRNALIAVRHGFGEAPKMSNHVRVVQGSGKAIAHAYGLFRGLNTWLAPVVLLSLFNLAAPPTASADTVDTFSVSGTFTTTDTFKPGSTLTIDIATGLATAADLIVASGGLGFVKPAGATLTGPPPLNTTTLYDWAIPDADCPSHFPTCEVILGDNIGSGFVGFTGGFLPVAEICGHCTLPFNFDATVNGLDLTLTSSITTPEPRGAALLLTCLVGLMVMARRIRRAYSARCSGARDQRRSVWTAIPT
jgi:hypothetical protein